MQFNVEWLKKWVAIDLDADTLAERLTAAGLEVDDVRPVAASFSNVVVAEIEDCVKHPNADKLSLCTVNDGGSEKLQIVCGAPNARAGIRVPSDLAVTGYDNTPVAHHMGLTSVEQHFERIGEAALSLLVDEIDGKTTAPVHLTVNSELIVRQSTTG